MKHSFCDIVENGRELNGSFGTDKGDRYGAFVLRCPKTGQRLQVIASSGDRWDEDDILRDKEPWEHVSVSAPNRCPFWEEMCWIKDLFFDDNECVVQFHPAKSEYVNDHPYVLHIWKPSKTPIPLPPVACV